MSDTTSRESDTIRHDGLEAVTPTEAARRLGITPDAVRARLRRGTLPGEQDGHEWKVFLPPEPLTAGDPAPGDQRDADTTRRVAERDNNTTRRDADTTAAVALIAAKDETIEHQAARIESLEQQVTRLFEAGDDLVARNAELVTAKDETITRLDAEVAYLREQLDHSRRELAAERERFDIIHREALQRIEALTAGPLDEPEAENAPERPSDAPGREEAFQGPESHEHHASWLSVAWRKLFGRS